MIPGPFVEDWPAEVLGMVAVCKGPIDCMFYLASSVDCLSGDIHNLPKSWVTFQFQFQWSFYHLKFGNKSALLLIGSVLAFLTLHSVQESIGQFYQYPIVMVKHHIQTSHQRLHQTIRKFISLSHQKLFKAWVQPCQADVSCETLMSRIREKFLSESDAFDAQASHFRIMRKKTETSVLDTLVSPM